jgi:hypothetical protein
MTLLFALSGILNSLLVIFSCNSFTITNHSSDFNVSLGLFRYTIYKSSFHFADSPECRIYDGTGDLNDTDLMVGSLTAAQVFAVLAPILSMVGCMICCWEIFCEKFYVSFQLIMSGSWLMACISQLLALLMFRAKDFW